MKEVVDKIKKSIKYLKMRVVLMMLIKYLILVFCCYYTYKILNAFSTLDFLNKNIIPDVSLEQVQNIFTILVILECVFVIMEKKLSSINIWIRRHRQAIVKMRGNKITIYDE